MDFDRKHGLAFLFSLAAVPMTGCPDDDPATTNTDDSSGSSSGSESSSVTNTTTLSTSADTTDTNPTTDGSSTESGSTGPSDSSSSDGSSGSSSGDGGSSGDSSSSSGGDDSSSGDSSSDGDSSSSSGDGEESSSSGDEPADGLCEGFAAKVVECHPEAGTYAQMLYACTVQWEFYTDYSMACGIAFEEELACIAVSECKELDGMTACIAENAALEDACGVGPVEPPDPT